MTPSQIDLVYERQWSSLSNLVSALQGLERMGRLYGGFPKFRYVKAGIPPEIIRTFPVASLWNYAIQKVHLPDIFSFEEPRWVGDWVARQSDLAPIVWANGTAHRFLFPKIKDSGRTLIVERGSMHPLDYFRQHQFAREDAGYSFSSEIPQHYHDEVEKTDLADFVVTCSDCVRDSYIRHGFPKEKLLDGTFGIDTSAFAFQTRTPPIQRPIRIAIVGVIGFRKGLHRLLRLGDWAERKGIALELHFAGPVQDQEAHELIAQSPARCMLHGTIKGEALQTMLRNSDLYALPSYEEGLPFSVLEAMSTGLAAIVSNDTGAREPVEHGKSGLVLHRFDDEEFDSEVEPMLRDPERIVEMGRRARTRIEHNYTLDHYCERIAKALEKIDAKRTLKG